MAVPLEWNVWVSDFNARKIETHNVFAHYGFWNDLVKFKRKYGKDREEFTKHVRSSMMYYYWSKCEWEVIIDHWPPSERYRKKKIDVFEQVDINFDKFMDYLWANLRKVKKLEEV